MRFDVSSVKVGDEVLARRYGGRMTFGREPAPWARAVIIHVPTEENPVYRGAFIKSSKEGRELVEDFLTGRRTWYAPHWRYNRRVETAFEVQADSAETRILGRWIDVNAFEAEVRSYAVAVEQAEKQARNDSARAELDAERDRRKANGSHQLEQRLRVAFPKGYSKVWDTDLSADAPRPELPREQWEVSVTMTGPDAERILETLYPQVTFEAVRAAFKAEREAGNEKVGFARLHEILLKEKV